jgi:formate hydrogenlyase subunit 3/multisubunit Na+/H+ antiporter MnhD subunit
VERFGFILQLRAASVPILAISLLMATAAFLLAARVSQGRSFVSLTLVLLVGYLGLALVVVGPLAPSLLAPLFLVALASAGVFVLQAGRLGFTTGPLRTLIPPVLAFPLFLLAAWYVEQIPLNPQDEVPALAAARLLAFGLLLLLAPVPLHSAQPATAQLAPPVVTALLTLLYQLAVLNLLFRIASTFPFVAEATPLNLWLTWAGIVTAVWGGVVATGASHPGRLWGYVALHDWGLILLVLAVPGVRSWPLALFLFCLRAVSLFTAAVGLSQLEAQVGTLVPERLQGAGSRLPWNSAAYLLGSLGLVGFPLSAGFTGHWAALQTLAEIDWRLAAVVLIASGGAVVGLVRLVRLLFGPLENRLLSREHPISAVTALVAVLLAAGLAVAPQLLDEPIARLLVAFSG